VTAASVRAAALAAALLACAGARLEAAARVRLIATGGTISNAVAGRLSPDALVRSLPGHGVQDLEIEREAFSNTASAALSLRDWLRLSRHIAELFAADPGLSGVVVTSGTDTLEELAFFLHLTVPGPRPVVIVGAMRRPDAPDADGPGNLLDALYVAADLSSRDRGTLVVMHGQVHAAVEARKLHASRVGAFDAPAGFVEGTVEGGRPRYSRPPSARPRPGALALAGGDDLPRVDVLLTYQAATGDLAAAAVEAGARGLVFASAGAGSLTPSQAEAATKLAGRGVTIVLATRAEAGDVTRAGHGPAGVVSAGGLPAPKARVLLMLALARGVDREAIDALFAEASAAIPR
jgi:L-asparaginase type II